MTDRRAAYATVIADLAAHRDAIDSVVSLLVRLRDSPVCASEPAPAATPETVETATAETPPLNWWWSEARLREMVRLRHQPGPPTWDDIAEKLGGATAKACALRYGKLRRTGKLDAIRAELGLTGPCPPAETPGARFAWTHDKHLALVRGKLAGEEWADIAGRIGAASANACSVQYFHLKRERKLAALEAEIGCASAPEGDQPLVTKSGQDRPETAKSGQSRPVTGEQPGPIPSAPISRPKPAETKAPGPISSRIVSPREMERMLLCSRPRCTRRKRRSGFCDLHEAVAEGANA